MSLNKRYNFKRILGVTVWTLLGIGTIVLLGAAIHKKNLERCKGVNIRISGARDIFFIDKGDVNTMLEKLNYGSLKDSPLNTFDLTGMELLLEKNEWIKSAELYFDNNDFLQIHITEREPVARIFNTEGASFYIDSSLQKLSLSDKFSASLPVFTGFPATYDKHKKSDSLLLNDVKSLATYIYRDPFWMAQVDQVDIAADRTFEIIPNVGNQVILFGSAENFVEKFNHLLIFYKKVESRVGWNKYSSLNVSYKNQVVAIKRGAQDIKTDSLKTLAMIKVLMANAQRLANDSAENVQLVQPKEDNILPILNPLDESEEDEPAIIEDSISAHKVFMVPVKPAATKQVITGKKAAVVAGGVKIDPPPAEKPTVANKHNAERPIKPAAKKITKPAPDKKAKVTQPANEY